MPDSSITGNFEVRILNTGELIYSAKRAGPGSAAKSRGEKMNILTKIEIALENME